MTEETKIKLRAAGREDLIDAYELLASGYAGINKKGTIVDRRDDTSAIPIPYNPMFPNTPAPKEIPYCDAFNKVAPCSGKECLRAVHAGYCLCWEAYEIFQASSNPVNSKR